MEILTFFAPLSSNPGALFIAGIIVGYGLKTLQSNDEVKKPKRYDIKVQPQPAKLASSTKFDHEPSFEWPDAVVESLVKRSRFDQSNEV